jgi:hypothetical protein
VARSCSSIKARLEQLFVLNSAAVIFYPDQPWEKTRDVAQRCKFQGDNDARRFSVVLEDGKRIDIDLETLHVGVQ